MQRITKSSWIDVLRVLGLISTQPAVRGLTSGFTILAEYDASQTCEATTKYADQCSCSSQLVKNCSNRSSVNNSVELSLKLILVDRRAISM
jgi:hypothetical protein